MNVLPLPHAVVFLCLVSLSAPRVDGVGLDVYAGSDPGDYITSEPWLRQREMELDLKPASIEGKKHTLTLRESLPSLLMAILAGLATVLGAFIVFLMPQGPPPAAMAFTLSLAAGVMVAVASELVWGEARGVWPWMFFIIGLFGTWFLVKIATYLESKTQVETPVTCNPQDDMDTVETVEAGSEDIQVAQGEVSSKPNIWRLAIVLFIALTLHNFPEGMAVAVSGLKSKQLGLTICIGIACHNIPEGITIAITTYDATRSKWKALLMTFLSAIAEPLGALSAIIIFRSVLTPHVVDCLVAIVAGVMLYISLFELLPEAYTKRRHMWLALGFIAGVVIIVITGLVLDHAIGA